MIDPSPAIQKIGEYAVHQHPHAPWRREGKNQLIPVVPIIHRNTSLMAVVWSIHDMWMVDTDLISSSTAQVSFSYTAVSQIRKNVARMLNHLCNSITFNSAVLCGLSDPEGGYHDTAWLQLPNATTEYQPLQQKGKQITPQEITVNREIPPRYYDSEFYYPDAEDEEGAAVIFDEHPRFDPTRDYAPQKLMYVYNCVNQNSRLYFDSTYDLWKGIGYFKADMSTPDVLKDYHTR